MAESDPYNFNRLFEETGGGPVVVDGRTLLLIDRFEAKFGDAFRVTIESTNSPYPQGVGISEDVEVFGSRAKRAVIWEYFSLPPEDRPKRRSELPFTFDVTCRSRKGRISFYNAAEANGRMEWWNYASCMIGEDTPGGRRYYCNDFHPDADFDDMVFRVERLTS